MRTPLKVLSAYSYTANGNARAGAMRWPGHDACLIRVLEFIDPMKKMLRNLPGILMTLGWRLQAGLALAVLLPVVAAVLCDTWIGQAEEDNASIVATHQRILAFQDLRSLLLEAESAQRGFLVNGDLQYQMNYDQTVPRIRALAGQMVDRYAEVPRNGPPRDARKVQQLSVEIGEKLSEMDIGVGYARNGDLERGRELVNTNRGFELAASIGRHIDELLSNEHTILEAERSARLRVVLYVRLAVATAWVLVLILNLGLLLLFSSLLAQKSRQARDMTQRHAVLDARINEKTDELKALSMDYQMGVERERAKLARDLHDELGSILTATKMDISWVQREIKEQYPAIFEKLKRTLRNLDQGIQFKRRVVQELHPSLLSTFGLIASVRSLAEDAGQRSNWQMELALPDDDTPIDETLALIIYRIVQESLSNAAKYAKAGKVSIGLMVDDEHMKLEIEDDGAGCDLDNLPGDTHGLQGIRHRATAIGGKVEFRSEPGKGLFTRVLLPRTFSKEKQHPKVLS
ncbi:signal transduction histidine kinase [Silvimonas terrae]|uniref:Signal transduction histidine kinase n=1 Tax=Silvimonas terrae TaxID=300266 RepID=A0A840RCP8_9NEIS|nr:CHASE3 domain-containing protein [Silvimonas terrae]MBB5190153.1 signal transduction histidine kinase [Silvimonas terrae]